MNKLLPLLVAPALLAAPAAAQDAETYYASPTWPVQRSAGGCTMVRTGSPETGFGVLRVGYDAVRDEVTLSTSEQVESSPSGSGTLAMQIVFVDNGETKYDDGWGSRSFAFSRDGDRFRVTSAFSGTKNVTQILADLTHSRRLGFLRDGEVLFDHDLAGAGPSIARLRACATSLAAAD